MSRDPNILTVWWEEMSFSALWHCHTNGDIVLSAWRNFKAARLSEQILMYFSDRIVCWIHKHIPKYCISHPERLANLPREMLSLIPKVHPKNPAPLLYCVLDPSLLQMSPSTTGTSYSAEYCSFSVHVSVKLTWFLAPFGVHLTGHTSIEFSYVYSSFH
jgi:hypothetical protein